MKHKTSILFPLILFFLLGTAPLQATTYTVKAGGGGNYTTISACAAAAVAGDTCQIFAGTYAGWTQSANGSAGNPITFTANTGDTVTVTSGIDLSGRGYITISRLALQGTISGNQTTNHCLIDHNTDTTTVFSIVYNLGTYTSADNVISNNTVTFASHSDNRPGVFVYGDRNRIENNTISGGGGDCLDVGGNNVVVRGNYCHDQNGAISGEHIDFVQNTGGGCPTLSQSLIENNREQNCTNDGGNCHFVISRTQNCAASDTLIIRYNYAQNLDGMAFDIGGVGDNVPNAHAYNNTIATEAKAAANGSAAIFYNAPNGVALNNIFYNTTAGGWSPIAGASSSDVKLEDGNLTFTAGYSGAFGSPYSTESTYAALHGKDPMFANYPTDGTLQASSPAIGSGVALTTVAAGDSGSGTSLMVADAHFFQPGWGNAQPDWIRVGASTTVQISSINYSTNTITLANGISRSSGNPVYLYRDSSGKVVLSGANPDIGAYYQGGAAAGAPEPPTRLAATAH